jgi:hypothetical protein
MDDRIMSRQQEMERRAAFQARLGQELRIPPLPPLNDAGSSAMAHSNRYGEPAENIYLDYAGMNANPLTPFSTRASRAPDRNDPGYWTRRVAEERRQLEEDGERAWQDLVRMRNLKDKFLKENRELIRDTAMLKKEVSSLSARLVASQAEVKRLKGRYQETWKDKVALAEELSVSKLLGHQMLSY